MLIIGVDFTSVPCRQKPITAAICHLQDHRLQVEEVQRIISFQSFALLLARAGPWIAAVDFPLGQPRRLIDDLKWKTDWAGYVADIARLGKREFRATLDAYRKRQPAGEKEHLRATDRLAKSISPMKVYGVPVGLMFCEGAPFVLASQASVLPLAADRDPSRTVIEGYPRLVVEKILGKANYKSDDRNKVNDTQMLARKRILDAVLDASSKSVIRKHYGLRVDCTESVLESAVQDHSGDSLDALLCSLQGAWAWTQRKRGFGIPANADPLEGWIVDPHVLETNQ